MPDHENLGSFFSENKTILKEYLETRLEIYRLQGIRMASKSIGFLVWMFLFVFLFMLVLIFTGLVLGFWLSQLTSSYVAGAHDCFTDALPQTILCQSGHQEFYQAYCNGGRIR